MALYPTCKNSFMLTYKFYRTTCLYTKVSHSGMKELALGSKNLKGNLRYLTRLFINKEVVRTKARLMPFLSFFCKKAKH